MDRVLGLWPSTYYTDASKAYKAENEKEAAIKAARNQKHFVATDLSNSARVNVVNSARMQAGYTLVCGEQSNLFLIDQEGKLVHEWKLHYHKAWPKPEHVAEPVPDASINCVSAYAYPNGDTLVVYHAVGDTPYGYGIAKMDKDSNVLWTYSKNAHHDVYVADDGKLYTLTQKMTDAPIKGLEDLQYPLLTDYINILSPDGQELDNIPLLDAFIGTKYEDELKREVVRDDNTFDYIHTNSIMPLEPAIADKFPMFEVGDLLVSSRNYNMIFVVSPQTRKVKWVMHGIWRGQHHARFLPNGHIMLFDNNGLINEGRSERSRLLEVDPADGTTPWGYMGKGKAQFYTDWNGSYEMQPNGNVLIASSRQGRLYEVTHDKEVVWAYAMKLPIYCARRYALNYFTKAFVISENNDTMP